jgi:hypothetical protein
MKNILLIISLLASFSVFAQPEERIQRNKVKIGKAAADKTLEFEAGDGASNPKLLVDSATKDFDFSKNVRTRGNTLLVGDGLNVNKFMLFDISTPSFPSGGPGFKWNAATQKVQVSHDGSTFVDVDAGGAVSPLTTAGDIWFYSTVDDRLPIGTLGQTLTAGPSNTPTYVSPWFVNAVISGNSVVSVISGSAASFTDLTNANLSLANATGSSTAQIACASGTAPSGTTCTAANESFGINFNVPNYYTGYVEVCAQFSHVMTLPSGSGLISSTVRWSIIETANNATTQLAGGNSTASFFGNMEAEANSQDFHDAMSVCDIFAVTASDNKTYRLMYKKVADTGSPTNNGIQANSGYLIQFTVRPIR